MHVVYGRGYLLLSFPCLLLNSFTNNSEHTNISMGRAGKMELSSVFWWRRKGALCSFVMSPRSSLLDGVCQVDVCKADNVCIDFS